MSITAIEPENTSSTQHETDTYKTRNDLHKRNNFTRSPSIEKIIKFNTFICSQSFYILPSILAWLKTSQDVLQFYAGKCITTIKSAVYATIFYKIIEAQFSIIGKAFEDVSFLEPKEILAALYRVVIETRASIENVSEQVKRRILKVVVYFSFFYVFLQLSLCLWTLSWVMVPFGLLFLLGCLVIISYANFQCLRFIEIQEMLKEEERNATPTSTHISRKYIRTRDILGKRTISNVKLF